MTNQVSVVDIAPLVLFQDEHLIAINKPAGILVQDDPSNDESIITSTERFCGQPLYIVHRLDRPASGVVVFAKTKKCLALLNEQFQKRAVYKTYLAVVKNKPEVDEKKLVHFLQKNQKMNRSFATDKPTKYSKKAILFYKYLKSIDNYTLLEVDLVTGRHHQIRTQLSYIGSPIKGDVKYKFRRGNKDRSIHLHSWKLEFTHPIYSSPINLTAPVPEDPTWDAFEIT